MTADEFRAWISHIGWNDTKVAIELGLSRHAVTKYKKEGAPNHIAYACAALAFGLPKWRGAVAD